MKVTLTGSIEVKGKLQRWHPSIKGEKKKEQKRKKREKKALSGCSKSKGECPRWRLLARA